MDPKPLSPIQIEQALADLDRQRLALLTGYVPEVEAARRLKVSRQALFKRPDRVKRDLGGIKTPAGWMYREDKLTSGFTPNRAPQGVRPTSLPFLV